MRQVLIFVSAVLFLSVACGESEALPSADIVPTSEVSASPPSEHPSAEPASLAIRQFAAAFNTHEWTTASRFVHPASADRFRDGVEHAAQSQARLQLEDVEVKPCDDEGCSFSVRWSMSPEGYCNPLFRRSGFGLSVMLVLLTEGNWVVREVRTFGATTC